MSERSNSASTIATACRAKTPSAAQCKPRPRGGEALAVGFENDAVTVTEGSITMFKSSPGTTRGFCARCGSTLTCATVHFPTETHYCVGAFDRAEELKPSKHVFANEQLPWLHLKDA